MIGKRLRQLRSARGLTQADLGRLVGVGKSAISQYESDARVPDAATLVRLAESLGVTTDWLLGVDGPPGDRAGEARVRYSAVPEGNQDRDFLDELTRHLGNITREEDRRTLLELARFLAQKQDRP